MSIDSFEQKTFENLQEKQQYQENCYEALKGESIRDQVDAYFKPRYNDLKHKLLQEQEKEVQIGRESKIHARKKLK